MVAKQRYAGAEAAGAGLWGNAGLALLKGSVGLAAGSSALLADAFRTAAEAAKCCISAAVDQGAGELQRSWGQGFSSRVESAVHAAAAIMLLLVGLETGIFAVREISRGIDAGPHWWALAALVLAFILKQWLFIARDKRTDRIAALIVFAGTGGAWLGVIWNKPFLFVLDPAAAVVIAILVMYNGFRLITGSLQKKTRFGLHDEDSEEMSEAAGRIDGVIAVEELRAWEQGHYVVVDLKISVNPRITVLEGQEIAKRVKEHLIKRFLHVTDVSIHVDPYDPGYPYKSNHDPNQEQIPTLLQ